MYQIVELKHKSDLVAAVFDQLTVAVAADVAAAHQDLTLAGAVHAAEHIEHRGLAGSRGADHHRKLSLLHGKGNTVHGVDDDLAHFVALINIFEFN